MRAFLDRIQNGIAVLLLGDDESVEVNIPLTWLPPDLKEGTCLSLNFAVDEKATQKAQEEIQALMDSMQNEP